MFLKGRKVGTTHSCGIIEQTESMSTQGESNSYETNSSYGIDNTSPPVETCSFIAKESRTTQPSGTDTVKCSDESARNGNRKTVIESNESNGANQETDSEINETFESSIMRNAQSTDPENNEAINIEISQLTDLNSEGLERTTSDSEDCSSPKLGKRKKGERVSQKRKRSRKRKRSSSSSSSGGGSERKAKANVDHGFCQIGFQTMTVEATVAAAGVVHVVMNKGTLEAAAMQVALTENLTVNLIRQIRNYLNHIIMRDTREIRKINTVKARTNLIQKNERKAAENAREISAQVVTTGGVRRKAEVNVDLGYYRIGLEVLTLLKATSAVLKTLR